MVKISLKPGRYVVAVSGGVDSVTLLHILMQKSLSAVNSEQLSVAENIQQKADHSSPFGLVVAHFDHGIRPNSADDENFVRELAKKYGLHYEGAKGQLGPDASEALAREKRYEFLRKIAKKHKATAILTAHHQDDVIETAIINVLRGTDRRGLSSLRVENGDVLRPLLNYTKSGIVAYAKKNGLSWVEDETNSSDLYLRNRVRKALLASDGDVKSEFLKWLSGMESLNDQIDALMTDYLKAILDTNGDVRRSRFIALDHAVARDFLAVWLRMFGIEFNRKLLEKLVIDLKVGKIHAEFDIDKHHYFLLGSKQISLRRR